MSALFTPENFFTLLMLVALQAVLGFDNLLYISIESKRVEKSRQAFVRHAGIGIAIFFRIALLFVVLHAVSAFSAPVFTVGFNGVFTGTFNVHSLITLIGGGFIIYTATKEISHLLSVENLEGEHKPGGSVTKALFWIVTMNLVFSFDSILSAMALSDVFAIMATAIVISGLLMIWLSDYVASFLEKNRMYEVMGLFILFLVGILLVTEGGHLAHIKLFGFAVEAMSKTTFYFVLAVIVITDVIQSRYQKKHK
ncbi:MAG: tellurium resistance protein TerC [Robiginitomaculum sp.]|nr:MAG: tellurium resistance protein TerC [Robiginitomaculum sp.]